MKKETLSLPSFELISYGEMKKRLPELAAIERSYKTEKDDDYDEAEYNDYFSHLKVFYFEGDISLNEEQVEQLKNDPSGAECIAVNGSLQMSNASFSRLYVKKDLHCDIFYQDEFTITGGRIIAKYFAVFSGDDDEVLHDGIPRTLETPYVFAWFFDLSNISMPADTIIFLLCGYSDYTGMELTQPHFYWHDDVYVLKPELCFALESHYYDAPYWNYPAIAQLLKAGESIFMDGYNIRSQELFKKGEEYQGLRQYKEAFALYKQAADLSPAYYQACSAMGGVLFQVGDFEQAFPLFDKASALFPQKHKNLNNRAADMAALTCVRLRRLDEAVEWATFSIESTKANPYDENKRYFPYRIRGEAHLLRGDWASAKTDMEKAVSMLWDNGSANWLMGLIYKHFGDEKNAKKYYQAAVKSGAKFSVDYATCQHADFVYTAPTTVDWLVQQTIEVKAITQDEAYWKSFLQRKGYGEFKKIPREFLTPAFCQEAINNFPDEHIYIAKYFPDAVFTAELASLLITRNAYNLQYIPASLITKALLLKGTKGPLEPHRVPVELWDEELSAKAVELSPDLDQLPEHLLNHALCVKAVQYNGSALDKVPGRFRDDVLYLTAVAYGDTWTLQKRIPKKYLQPEMLCRAIDINFMAVHRIPGMLINEVVFAYAAQRSPDPDTWEKLKEEHGPNFRKYNNYASCNEICWAVYWDEELMLKEIQTEEGYHLSPYEIPEEKYTQAVAEATFLRDPFHLGFIPKKFRTPAMEQSYAAEYGNLPDEGFDLKEFESLMQEADMLVGVKDHKHALEVVMQAEKLLQEAHHTDHALWAYILDHQRFLTYELGLFAENENICRNIVTRFRSVQTWPYIESDNIIRAALRGAHNLLAWRLSEGPATPETIEQATDHIEKTFRISPIEDAKTLLQFYETKAKVYLWAAALKEDYREEADRMLEMIRKGRLVEKGLVVDEAILKILQQMK